jgi:uncharacterized protein
MTKLALITGASGGIGESLARQLAAKGNNILLVARNEDKLRAICEECCNKYGITADYIVADLAQPNGPDTVFKKVQEKNLSVDLLVNNAGIGSSGEFSKNDLPSELAMLQLNNSSMVALCRLFLPGMIARNGGTIVNVGSVASFIPSPYMAVYAASKAFVRSFTQAITEECKPYNVHVLFFAPGLTSSNFMNTPANNNAWGRTLTAGAPTQTVDEVAAELVQALQNRKTVYVSGRQNRLAVRLTALIPQATIARIFATRKRKQVKE